MQTSRFPKLYNMLKRRALGHLMLVRAAVLALIIAFAFAAIVIIRPHTGLIVSFLIPLESQITNTAGRTNLVILGMGGTGHEAPNLTDTIIWASIELNTGKTILLSLPRDIWVPSMRAKINTAFHYGEKKQPGGGGLVLAKSAVAEIIDQPVHYAVVLDFSAFVKLVDLLGGLDVNVENAFTDFRYPIPGKEMDDCGKTDPEFNCRYETLSFAAGPQRMDGALALKYVRSRHSDSGAEGTDYARSRRQLQVVKALQSRLVSLAKNPGNFSLLQSAYDLVAPNLITDFPYHSSAVLAKLAFKINKHPLQTHSLAEPDTLFHPPISPAHDHQWVLLPKDNNPKLIHAFVKGLLD